jgi:hypothetical protein
LRWLSLLLLLLAHALHDGASLRLLHLLLLLLVLLLALAAECRQ